MLEAEIKILRKEGIERAAPDEQADLAVLLDTWHGRDRREPFDEQVAAFVTEALTPYIKGKNPLALIAMEVLRLDPTTKGMTPTAARKAACARVKKVSDPGAQMVDTFSRNEEKKALAFTATAVQEAVGERPPGLAAGDGDLPTQLTQALTEAGVTRFFSSREGYRKYRDSRDTIGKYVSLANRTIEMVSINLASGHDVEQVADTFEAAITRPVPVKVRVSLIDPEQSHLISSIAPVLDLSEDSLVRRIEDTMASLERLQKERLARNRRPYLELWCHRVLPNASAIILDGDEADGRIQLETKGFRTGMGKSWGFEVQGGTDFYNTLRDSYRDLIAHGRQVL